MIKYSDAIKNPDILVETKNDTYREKSEKRRVKKNVIKIQLAGLAVIFTIAGSAIQKIASESHKVSEGKKIIELIGENRSAEEVEKEFSDGIAQINGEVTRAIEKRNGIMVTRENISGSIAQMTKTLADVEARLTVAKEEIAVFMSKRKDNLAMEQLHALFATGSDEVARLRKAIDTLRSNLLKAEATHKERLQAVEEHRKSPHKPAEEENIADIEKEIEEIGTRNKSLLDKMGEANSKLKLKN